MRFALSTLLVLTVLASLASASLVSHSDLLPNALLTLAVLCPLYFLVQVVYCRESKRAFAVGFVVFSAGYLLFAFGPFREQVEPGLVTSAALTRLHEVVRKDVEAAKIDRLPDGTPVFAKHVAVESGAPSSGMYGQMMQSGMDAGMGMSGSDMGDGMGMAPGMGSMSAMGGMGSPMPARVRNVTMVTVPLMPYFKRAGHALFAILIGIVGGALARHAERKGRQQPAPSA